MTFPSLIRRSIVAAGTAAALGALASAAAQAQGTWPQRPLRMIINLPPGSSPDVVGRAVAQPLQ